MAKRNCMYCCAIGRATVMRSNSTGDTQQRTNQQTTRSRPNHDEFSMNMTENKPRMSYGDVTHRCNAMVDLGTMFQKILLRSSIHTTSAGIVSFVYVLRTRQEILVRVVHSEICSMSYTYVLYVRSPFSTELPLH